jgi:hypothetical protein
MSDYKYNCEYCVFHTNMKQNYNSHLLSKRHISMLEPNNTFIFSCEKCSKKFKGQSGLWRHSKVCFVKPIATVVETVVSEQVEMLTEKIDKLSNMVIELKSNHQPTSITNNQHNTFNVNLFLNENATQAKNFIDMIQNISVKGPYPEQISSANYVSSVVKMITNEIDKLPIDERPIHCIKNEDENQKILHIRHDDKWKKEVEIDWTSQIHNYFHDTGEEPSPEEEKIIFNGIKQLEENIKTEIEKLNNVSTKYEYNSELGHPPNRVNIIKCLLDYVNIEKDQLLKIVENAYKKRNHQIIREK